MPFNVSLLNLDILNVLSYGAALYNKAGKCIFANDVFLKFAEIEKQTLTACEILELPFLQNDEELKSKINEIYESGESFRKNISGKNFHFDVNLSLFESSGESFLLISLYDISELFTAEGFHYRDIFYNSPLGMYKTTPSGKILMANPAMLKMLGFSSFAELSKRNLEEDGYSNISESRKEFKRKLEEQGELIGYENAWLTNDGKTIYIRENARVLRNSDGSVFYEGTVEDITSKIELEKKIADSEKRFRSLIQNSSDVVILIDTNGEVTYISPSIKNVTGFNPEDQLGTIGFDWIHPDDLQNIIVDFHRLAAGEISTMRKELRVLNVKNEWIWIEAVAYNLLNDPAVGAIVVNYRDINETKMAAKQLKELNERKDKFFSIIAHDLKSPFTSLLGLTEYLKNDFDQLTNDEIKIFTGNIYQAAKSVFNLLDNLLQWARFQTGSIDFTPVTFNVGTVIKDVLDLYNVNILKKNISVVYDPKHNFKVYADKFMAATIIRNIFSNAIKYTPHKGSITISVTGNYLETTITITDTGVGIPKEIMNRLFNVGDKISTYGTDDEPGTGLGLILCKDFVEKNGGKIFVESEVDKGTCFNIVLPSIVNNE